MQITNRIVTFIAALAVGSLAMWVGGFGFANDAASLFLAKLPVFLLVALLIERTAEIFLTIWRGPVAVTWETELNRLKELKAAQVKREARLAELPPLILACNTEIANLTPNAATKAAELKVQEEKKAALEREQAELRGTKLKEDAEISQLEAPRNIETRSKELLDYKNDTRSVALTFNFVLSLFVAGCGFRAIEGLVILRPVAASAPAPAAVEPTQVKALLDELKNKTTIEEVTKWQEEKLKELEEPEELKKRKAAERLEWEIGLFRLFDILLTAGLLAGGADPISRIMKLLRDFLDQSNKQLVQQGQARSP